MYIKIGEVARMLGVSTGAVRDWVERGKLTCTRTPGGTRLFEKEDVEKLISKMCADKAE